MEKKIEATEEERVRHTPYQPELRSIPLTFLDCPDFKQVSVFDVCDYYYGTLCHTMRMKESCPRGYP